MIFGNPPIVTNGLVLHLDAGSRKSYVSGSTVWNDLSGLNNSGSLVNGPTFSRANQGSIVFDGVDDYISLPNGLLSGTGDFTINQFVQCLASIPNGGGTTFGNYPQGNLQIFYGTRFIGMWLNNSTTYLGTSPWNTTLPEFTTNPTMITFLRTGGSTTSAYLNGILQKTGSSTATIGISTNQFRIGTNTSNVERYTGQIYITQVYNRALSATEIAQNYNALKSRFGLS
jgi:hypothetical protein